MIEKNNDLMEKVVSLCKRRGFIYPGSEIYGGLSGTWDYGPHGTTLKQNIKNSWWKRFVTDREDMQEHVDVHLHNFNTDHTILVDHKGRKFLGPWSDEVKLVEYKNVNGHPGWIFGKADYFAFQHIDHFLMVRKETLLFN